jgi:hypothetical protein
MKSYVKIYGPPLLKALKALEKVAIGLPEVCIMNTTIETASAPVMFDSDESSLGSVSGIMSYFGGPDMITEERCDTIISKSGESLGEYDFYFEWFKKPSMNEIMDLIERIDEALADVGVKYTITSK